MVVVVVVFVFGIVTVATVGLDTVVVCVAGGEQVAPD